LKAWQGLWTGELTIHTRRGGRMLLGGAAARLAGWGLAIAGPGFAALPLGMVVRRPTWRLMQSAFAAGSLCVAALIWRLFQEYG
jgi:hypothetical protein